MFSQSGRRRSGRPRTQSMYPPDLDRFRTRSGAMKSNSTVMVGMFLVLAATAASSACLADAGTNDETELRQSAVIGVDEFLYFRSNATGWGVDDSTRLSPFGGGAFARTYNVTQDWMITTGDNAIVTRTNQLNGWG